MNHQKIVLYNVQGFTDEVFRRSEKQSSIKIVLEEK
jgi:hypothetical protein